MRDPRWKGLFDLLFRAILEFTVPEAGTSQVLLPVFAFKHALTQSTVLHSWTSSGERDAYLLRVPPNPRPSSHSSSQPLNIITRACLGMSPLAQPPTHYLALHTRVQVISSWRDGLARRRRSPRRGSRLVVESFRRARRGARLVVESFRRARRGAHDNIAHVKIHRFISAGRRRPPRNQSLDSLPASVLSRDCLLSSPSVCHCSYAASIMSPISSRTSSGMRLARSPSPYNQ